MPITLNCMRLLMLDEDDSMLDEDDCLDSNQRN